MNLKDVSKQLDLNKELFEKQNIIIEKQLNEKEREIENFKTKFTEIIESLEKNISELKKQSEKKEKELNEKVFNFLIRYLLIINKLSSKQENKLRESISELKKQLIDNEINQKKNKCNKYWIFSILIIFILIFLFFIL